jgi:hypothetical protein
MILLVIWAHLAILYSWLGSSIRFKDTVNPVAGFILIWSTLFLQAFVMSGFSFVSGLFAPGSYDRKGSKQFILDRLLRIGVPLLVYDILINPLIVYSAQVNLLGDS